jgi:hypothetical protein
MEVKKMSKGNKKILLATAAVLMIVASTIPGMAVPQQIVFDGDQVNFRANAGDTWHVTLNGTSYSGVISETKGKDPWKVAFGCRSPGWRNSGVFFDNIKIGEYSASAWINSGEAVKGDITVTNSECKKPPPPVPELSPIILVTAGLIGIVAVSRKFKKN